MQIFAVVPIVINAGAAVLPTIVVALASVAAIVLHPKTLWQLMRRRPWVTALVAARPEPKFALLNRLLRPSDVDDFDFVIACDDDIYLPRGFLPAYIAFQQKFDFAVAQPSRAWHSHFDHSFALRRPWLQARQTRFVECGPLVSLRRDAARLLLPFDQQDEMWGIDLVWAEVIDRHRMRMGVVDALSVDHSLRPQASTYDKATEAAAMNNYLSNRPHIPMHKVFTVVKRYHVGAREYARRRGR